ncbi:MAG TPA: V-type ATP synthase subunit E family protein [Coriobacteriia bacterium]|nr:V-type ATP synthase subunit E family protein [Coriobacteriia bacterium]
MALGDILRRIERDSLEEADGILASAERSAADVRARGGEHARVRADGIVARARAEAESAAQTTLAEARLAARDKALTAKHQLVERVIAHAAERAGSLSAERYAALLATWVTEVATGGEVVSIGHEDHGRLNVRLGPALKAVGAPVTIRGTTAAISRGVLVEGDRVRVEVSIRARIESRREEFVGLAASALFDAERHERVPETEPALSAGDEG